MHFCLDDKGDWQAPGRSVRPGETPKAAIGEYTLDDGV